MLVLQRLWGDASALLNLQGLRVRYGSCISSRVPQVGPMHRYPRVRFPVSSLCEKVKISMRGMYGNRLKTPSLLMMDAQLKLAVNLPDIKEIHFRYDPAVLIVSLAWGETQISFGAQLHCHLSRRYVNDPSSVGLPMDLRLTANADPHAGHVTECPSQGYSRRGA